MPFECYLIDEKLPELVYQLPACVARLFGIFQKILFKMFQNNFCIQFLAIVRCTISHRWYSKSLMPCLYLQ